MTSPSGDLAGAGAYTIVSGGGPYEISKGPGITVTVQYEPSGSGVTDNAAIAVTSNDPKHPMASVVLSGKGK